MADNKENELTENEENIDLELEINEDLNIDDKKDEDIDLELDLDENMESESSSSEAPDSSELLDEASLDSALPNDLKEKEEYPLQKKQTLLHKLLIGIAALLGLIVIAGATLYFMGYFEPPKPPPKPKNLDSNQTMENNITKKYSFEMDQISVPRVNKKLSLLTKYEIIEDEKTEEAKLLEKERLYKEEQEKLAKLRELEKQRLENENKIKNINLDNEIKKEQEAVKKTEISVASLYPKENNISSKENNASKEDNSFNNQVVISGTKKIENNTSNTKEDIKEQNSKFMMFAKVATIKHNLYKSFLDSVKEIDDRVSVCRDNNNNIEIFIGPMKDEESRTLLISKINKSGVVNDSFPVDLTQEEFDKRCNF